MSKARHGKSAFFVVMVSLLLCGVLAIGATYAFTARSGDTYVLTEPSPSPLNKEMQGYEPYKVDLISYGSNSSGNGVALIKDGAVQAEADAFGGVLLSPGGTEIVYFEVRNNEAMPLLCSVKMQISNVSGSNSFDNTLTYKLYEGNIANAASSENWIELNAGGTENKEYTLVDQAHLGAAGSVNIADEHCFAIAIHMAENASNNYQNAAMNVTFSVQVDSNDLPGTTPSPTPASVSK
ncbi:MAG: hypothetical protein IJ466_12145 [Clostridia bacterium]|nr:hypothetical protein [Clostridia bacterium]